VESGWNSEADTLTSWGGDMLSVEGNPVEKSAGTRGNVSSLTCYQILDKLTDNVLVIRSLKSLSKEENM